MRKFTAGIILVSTLVCGAAILIGYREYTTVLEKQYNDTAYGIANTALTYLDGDKIQEYLKTGQTDAAYGDTKKKLDSLLVTTDSTYIYVAAVDPEDYITLTYVFDAFNAKRNLTPYQLGDQSPDMNPKYSSSLKKIMETGERSNNYFYSYSKKFGAHTTAAVRITNSKGEAVAFVGVEKSMSALDSARKAYVLYVLIAAIIVTTLLIGLYILYYRKTLIKPIQAIEEEAADFIQKEDHNERENRLSWIQNKDEIGTLAKSITQMEADIRAYIENLTKVTKEKERIGAELNVATQIQADMLPRIFPPYPDRNEFDLFATMDPAKEVGGDFYDFFMTDSDHLAIVIGDVSGKGVPAALFMVISKTLIKNYAMMGLSPEEVFTRTNNDLCEGNEAELFTTAWIGIYEVSTGKLRFADAGHETPLRLRPDGTVMEVRPVKKKMVLAAMENIKYIVSETTLEKGDMLLIYTDGVPEATNAHNELYGMERLTATVGAYKGSSPEALLQEIRTSVDTFVGDAPQFDDLTMLALEIKTDEQRQETRS